MKPKLDIFFFIKKNALWLCLGAVALIVVLLVADAGTSKSGSDNSKTTVEAYRVAEEKRLKTLLEKTEGVGRADVMIRVSKSEEIVTAKDTTSQSEKTVVIDLNGEEALSRLSTVSPVVSGVVVVCDGGGSISVKNEIVQMISRLYGLSAAEIYVSQRGE